MVKEIVLIILLFNGELKLTPLPFEGTVHECFAHGNQLRMEHATYNKEQNVWYMNHGPGTWQGFICG